MKPGMNSTNLHGSNYYAALSRGGLLIILLAVVIFGGCKMQGPFYSSNVAGESGPYPPEDSVTYSVFLAGDAGDATHEAPLFSHLKKLTAAAGGRSAVVNLGDNAYPTGLPEKTNKWRGKAEEALKTQVNAFEEYSGSLFFMAGNHDWAKGKKQGYSYLMRQERFLNEQFGEKVFFPGKGCPGPSEIPLNDTLTLVIIDSQWYLYNFDKPLNEDDCGIEEEADIFVRLEDIMRRNSHKTVLIAAHHPLYSIGVHGGRFNPWLNLFPLTVVNKYLYIPLPGFIYTGGRKYFGHIQDIAHPKYEEFRRAVLDITKRYANVIYAAGHEHNLQYAEKEGLYHIISGSASKTSQIVHNSDADFGLAALGFARIDFTRNGEVWLKYYHLDEQKRLRILFTKHLFTYYHHDTPSEQTGVSAALPDSVSAAPGDRYRAGSFKKALLGENYRKLWAQPVKARVFDIGNEKGGITPVKRGGGMQTLSVRLEADDKKQYNLRSLDKYAARTVPDALKETFAAALVQDNVSATNPYGALVAAELASQSGLYHTNPEVVFVPDDPRFGIYRQDVDGQLFLFEERPDEDWRKAPFFGNSKNIKSTSSAMEDRLEDNDLFIDQQFVLKNRLFDMFINDWDRHGDQWRWATHKDNGQWDYKPIPRDRDNALFLNEGIIPSIAKRQWAVWRLQGLNEEMPDERGLNFNARYFDRFFLNEPSREVWRATARQLQQLLDDETIESGVQAMPPEAFDLVGKRTIRLLKKRRDNLLKIAENYYEVLARTVNIYGSEDDDYFEVTRKADGATTVKVYDIKKDDEKAVLFYSRTFYPSETEEIRLYGIDDEDKYLVKGQGRKGIKVRIITSDKRNHIADESFVKGWGRKTIVYEGFSDDSELLAGPETAVKQPVREDRYHYDAKAFKYGITSPAIFFGYNAEDGVFLGGGFSTTKHGFKKEPYKARHSLAVNHSTHTSAFNLKHRSEFIETIGAFDLVWKNHIFGPNYTSNFFGYGNESRLEAFDFENDKAYNYVRREAFALFPSLRLRFGSGQAGAGAFLQSSRLRDNSGRYVTQFESNDLEEDILETKSHAGVKGYLEFDTRNQATFPTAGIVWKNEAAWYSGLNSYSNTFSALSTDFRIYLSRQVNPRAVLALRFGGAMNRGTFDFIHANHLGGKTNLRGYPATRFYGDDAAYQNTDLRIKLKDIHSYYFSGQIGVFGFHDIGRVWYSRENSDKWHQGYGGGIWVSPFGMAVITARYALSEEYDIFRVKFDFRF